MSSYIFNIWSDDQAEQTEQTEQTTEQISQTDDKPVIIENETSFDNFINELKNFHENGKLRKMVISKKPEPKVNPVWKEVMEQRQKILKLETKIESSGSLEERVEKLEALVQELVDELKGQSWRSSKN